MAQHQVQQRGGRPVRGEAMLRPQLLERHVRRVDQPAEVVAPVVGVCANRIRLGQQAIVDERALNGCCAP